VRRSLITLLFLPGILAAAWAQPAKVTFDFGSDGTRKVWLREASDASSVGTPVSVTGISADIEVTPGKIVGVYDEATGKAAEKPADDILKTKSWKLAAADFTRLGRLEVTVVYELKPVAAGNVMVSVAGEQRTALLTPGDKGKVEFWNLPSKPLVISFTTKFEGKEVKTPAMSMNPSPGKDGMKVNLPVSEKVDVVGAEAEAAPESSTANGASPAASEEKPKEAPKGSNPLGTLVSLFIGLAILGALGYGVYMYFRGSPDQAKDLLKKAGLDPDAADQAAQAQAPSAPAPQPIQKIVLDDAAPTPFQQGAAVVAGAVGAVQDAVGIHAYKLVGPNGEEYDIRGGEYKIGREGADISFGADSGVSRSHAVISRNGGVLTITDLGSTNGTYVNGVKITGATELKAGDLLILGTVRLRCE
jgi:hypothetical protein